MTAERVLLGVMVVAFYGYYLLPPADRAWMYYVSTGVATLTLAALAWPRMRSHAGRLACAVCVLESAQQAICGAAQWGTLTTGQDLCKAWLGPDPYAAIVSLALAAAITWGVQWRTSN